MDMADVNQVLIKAVEALSNMRDAMNKMQSEAGMMKDGMCEVVAGMLKTRVEMLKMEREAGAVRRELDQLRAEVAHMKKKERYRELLAQESRLVFSDAGDVRRRAAREAELGVAELGVTE
jgi:hypothetical protein